MTSANGNIFRVTGHLCGVFPGPRWIPTQRPVTRSFDVFFDRRLNKRLIKQSWGWLLETLSRPLWRHRNAMRSDGTYMRHWNLSSFVQAMSCHQFGAMPIVQASTYIYWLRWGLCLHHGAPPPPPPPPPPVTSWFKDLCPEAGACIKGMYK